MQVTAVCLNWLSGARAAGPFDMGSFSSTTRAISVGFSFCLSVSLVFSDVPLRPGKYAGRGKKREHVSFVLQF